MTSTFFPPKCTYSVVGNHIESDGTVKKRVSGTAMGGILGCSPWSSPFQVACTLLGLCSKDISSKPAVITGQILERPLIRYADVRYGSIGQFIPADEIFVKRAGDHDAWVSDFNDDVFAGHVDGIVLGTDGNEYILEVKTSSNDESWADGVPEYYFWQIALYNHFICKQDKAYVLLGRVDEYTHRNPNSFTKSDDSVKLIPMDIDREMVGGKLDEVREWYDTYIAKGITPDYDPDNPGDVEMYEHLCNIARTVDDVTADISRLVEVEKAIEKWEDQKYDLYTERELLRGNIKAYMIANNLNRFDSEDGSYSASVTTQTRRKLDEHAMMLDGIDVDKYMLPTTVKTFSIKKNKK